MEEEEFNINVKKRMKLKGETNCFGQSGDGRDTIITCDNGIAAYEQIRHAKDEGLTVVVTDHHEVPFEDDSDGDKEILPPADAVIDPKRADGNCSFKEICGAVVAYKFLQMMARISGRSDDPKVKAFFDEMLITKLHNITNCGYSGKDEHLVKESLNLRII